MHRDRAERVEQRKMDFYAKEAERIDHQTGETEIPRSDSEGEDRGEPEQDLSGEISIPSADETLAHPEIPAVPSGSTPSRSLQSLFKQWCEAYIQ